MKRKKVNVKRLKVKIKERRNHILNAFLQGKKLYIKNTGIEVKITDFNQWAKEHFKTSLHVYVKLCGTPSIEALDKLSSFNIDMRDDNGVQCISVTGEISILELSTNPFETKASKILHGG
jgi:hypothetical protein